MKGIDNRIFVPVIMYIHYILPIPKYAPGQLVRVFKRVSTLLVHGETGM